MESSAVRYHVMNREDILTYDLNQLRVHEMIVRRAQRVNKQDIQAACIVVAVIVQHTGAERTQDSISGRRLRHTIVKRACGHGSTTSIQHCRQCIYHRIVAI